MTIKLRPGVKFNDGTAMDAESVKFSLDRHRTLKGSNRASELAPVEAVEVVDPRTVRLRLKAPFSPLLAQLTDRAGMPVSPTAVNKLGDKFGTAPVSRRARGNSRSGWRRIASSSSSRRIISIPRRRSSTRSIFRIIPDDNVRLANLRSGDIDVMHMVSPTDATAIKREGRFELSNVTGLGYDGITINLRNKTGKLNPPGDLGTPLANDPRVREALELSDRPRSAQPGGVGWALHAGLHADPARSASSSTRAESARAATWPAPRSSWPTRGTPNGYGFELTVVNNPRSRRVGEVIQQMAREAGFNITLRAQEFASALTDNDDGKHQTFQIGWSGRVDPDGNIHQIQTCKGSLNATLACDEKIDALLNRAREVSDVDQRRGLYREAIDLFTARRNIIYLYHQNYIVAFPKNLKGYKAVPDGLIRIKGTSWN